MTYAEQLRDPRWQKKRLKILDRDNWTCQEKRCKTTTKNLQVHHLQYLQGINVWDYPDDMLLTLCEDCHKKENERPELEKHLANTLRMKGFLLSDLLAMSCLIETDVKFSSTLLGILRDFQHK